MRTLALLPLLLLGCGTPAPCATCGKNDGSATADMTVQPSPDMASAADLAEPADLVATRDFAGLTFCANTTVAGTCAQAFFQQVSMCFNAAGACTTMQDMQQGYANFCWANGNKLLATVGQTMAHGTWLNGKVTCMDGDVTAGPTFALTSGGQKLIYNDATGDVTCPDGSTTNIGADYGGCTALKEIISPSVGACQPGVCP